MLTDNQWSEIRSQIREGKPLKDFSREVTGDSKHPPIAELQLRFMRDPVLSPAQTLSAQADDVGQYREIIARLLPKISDALDSIDLTELAQYNPRLVSTMIKDLAAVTVAIHASERNQIEARSKLGAVNGNNPTEQISLEEASDAGTEDLTKAYFDRINAQR